MKKRADPCACVARLLNCSAELKRGQQYKDVSTLLEILDQRLIRL
jgi:hypothetical protein